MQSSWQIMTKYPIEILRKIANVLQLEIKFSYSKKFLKVKRHV